MDYKSSNVYNGGSYTYTTDGGSSWTDVTGDDTYFKIYELYGVPGRIYKARSGVDTFFGVIGIAKEDGTKGNTSKIRIAGFAKDGFSGLQLGKIYYVSTTAGQLTISSGGSVFGTPISSTEMMYIPLSLRYVEVGKTIGSGTTNWYTRDPVSYTHLTLPTTPYV